jgi:hypothetical protein
MHSTGSSFGERRRLLREWRSNPSKRVKAARSNLNAALGKLPFTNEELEELIAAGEFDARTTKAGRNAFKGLSPDDLAHVQAVMKDRSKCVNHLLKTLCSKDDLDASWANIQALAFVINMSMTLGSFFVHPAKNRVRVKPAIDTRKERAELWHKPALRLATEILKEHPDWTNNRIATQILPQLQKLPSGPTKQGTITRCLDRKLDRRT